MFIIKNKAKKLWLLFYTFFKIGAFTFGGGYAMIPLISREIVKNRKWITDDDILDIVAIAESTPGPIAINSATFVGYKVGGFFGAMTATIGITLPSLIVITVIAYFLDQFMHIQAIKYAFMGIRVGVVVLIIKALISMYKQCPKNIVAYIVMALAFIAAGVLGFNVLATLVVCALIGVVSSAIAARRNEK